MRPIKGIQLLLGLVAWGSLATTATAGHGQEGSLLIYPEFDNRPGVVTLLSATNTNETEFVNVEFVYIGRDEDGLGCFEFNRIDALTPNDTLTVITSFHNPSLERGFVYAVAKDPDSFSTSISYDWLMGSTTVIDGLGSFSYSVEPFAQKSPLPSFQPTDLDGDGLRDLDGLEYEPVADRYLIPRFLGEDKVTSSDLILVNLTLTIRSEAVVQLLVWNDNEEIFSTEHSFSCWDRVSLLDVSGVFSNEFLSNFTDNDPSEIVGATGQESGWIRLEGAVASTAARTVLDPAILALLVERAVPSGAGASLPFEVGARTSGSLVQFNELP